MSATQAGGFQPASQEEMQDMFSNIFRGRGGGGFADIFEQQAAMQGPDIQSQVRITLREAAEGVSKTVHIPVRADIRGKRETRSVKVDIPAGGFTAHHNYM